MDHTIKRFVQQVRKRIREQKIIEYFILFSISGIVLAFILAVLAMVIPFYHAIIWESIVIGIAFVLGILWGIFQTPTMTQAALKADAKGFQEKITTAYELRGKQDAFSVLQKTDALSVIENYVIRKEFPITINPKRIGIFLMFLCAFLLASIVDTPAKRKATADHGVAIESKEEIARIEKLEKEIKQNYDSNLEEIQAVLDQLELSKEELRKAEDFTQLQKAKERIHKKLEMKAQDVQDKNLSQRLQEASKEAQSDMAKEKEQLAKEAEEALEKARNGTDKQRQEAYEKLKELAAKTSNQQLSDAADAYRDGEYSERSYATVSNVLSKISQNLNGKEQNVNLVDVQQQSAKENTNHEENGFAALEGTTENGTLIGRGNVNAGAGGSGWDYGGKDGQEGSAKTRENVTVPEGQQGTDENLTGKQTGNQNSTAYKSNQSSTWSGNKVQYDQVAGKYKERAYKRVNGSNYPAKMKERIKRYFDELN